MNNTAAPAARADINTIETGARVYTTVTTGRGTAVHYARAEVIERHGRKMLRVVGRQSCAQPHIRSGATRVHAEATCTRCAKYDHTDLPLV